jgi:RHS repeat-associated protein
VSQILGPPQTLLQSVVLEQSSGVPTNRLTSVTTSGVTKNYTYDAAGNVTNDGTHTYQYDGENRVVSVDNGTTASYAYDHQNRRIKKTIGSGVTHCVWEGGQVIAEYDGTTSALLNESVYSGGRLIAKFTGSATRYYLSDRLSERLTLDASGNVVGRQAHLPFGEELGTSGEQEKHKLTNYERDTETGWDYAANRVDSLTIGRFSQADPYRASGYIVDPQSWHRYRYSRNDPVNWIDPKGLEEGFISGSAPGSIGSTFTFNTGLASHFGLKLPLPFDGNALPQEDEEGSSGGSGNDYDDIIRKALADTETVLTGGLDEPDSSCRAFFGYGYAITVLHAFGEQMIGSAAPLSDEEEEVGIRQWGDNWPFDGGRYRLFSYVLTNQNGPFFQTMSRRNGHVGQRLRGFGHFEAGTNGGRVLAILHELAHLIMRDGKPLIPNDGGTEKSPANTALIEAFCGNDIRRLLPDWNRNR